MRHDRCQSGASPSATGLSSLRDGDAQRLHPDGLQSPGAGVLPMAREFGDKLGGSPWVRDIEQPQPVTPPVRVGSRAGVWPPEVLEEIHRIYSGGEQ